MVRILCVLGGLCVRFLLFELHGSTCGRISSLCPETKPLAEFLPRRFDANGALLKRVRINQPDRPQSEWTVKRSVWSGPHPFFSGPVECVSEHGMTQFHEV